MVFTKLFVSQYCLIQMIRCFNWSHGMISKASGIIGKMLVPLPGTLAWYPSCLKPARSPLEGDIPNRYPLNKVYMGLIIKGTIPRVPPFSP